MSDISLVHECRMPRWRIYRWRHRIYICDCDSMWTIRTSTWAGPHGPTNSYRWIRIGLWQEDPEVFLEKVAEAE